MSQIPVTVKIDAELKQEVQKLAKSLGLSLSAISRINSKKSYANAA
ncbi:MAG: ribbon-helix-helix protein, CopG family [Candidatus Saccharimonadales bacterium]